MSPLSDYTGFLKKDLGKPIEALKLEDLQKNFLRSPWLDQVLWMEAKPMRARNDTISSGLCLSLDAFWSPPVQSGHGGDQEVPQVRRESG